MTPDIELQLKAVIKSLKDNVRPAIDPGNQLGQEQMHLSIATLEIVLGNLPFVHGYLRKDLWLHRQMAEKLAELIGDETFRRSLQAAIATADRVLSDPACGFTALQRESRDLRESICRVLRDHGDSPYAAELERCVIELSAESMTMGRAWTKGHGFEPRPDEVAEIETLGLNSR